MNKPSNLQVNGTNDRKPRALVVYVVLMVVLGALCLGVYFGLFIGMRVFGGG